jgi:hypothetical protein
VEGGDQLLVAGGGPADQAVEADRGVEEFGGAQVLGVGGGLVEFEGEQAGGGGAGQAGQVGRRAGWWFVGVGVVGPRDGRRPFDHVF